MKSCSFDRLTRHSHNGGEIEASFALSRIEWNSLIPRIKQWFAGVSRYTRSWRKKKKNDKTPFLATPGLVCRRRFRREIIDFLDVKSLVEQDSVE